MNKELTDAFNRLSYGYQRLASNFCGVLDDDLIEKYSSYENERLEYIKQKISFKDARILDIGGNTGFFSYESINSGAVHADYYEGNGESMDFMKKSVEFFKMEDKINMNEGYYSFDEDHSNKYDIAYLLNVVHHIGGRSGDEMMDDMEEAKRNMIAAVNAMSANVSTLIFQMGFNWRGEVKHCLFTNGTKKEVIDFITEGTRDHWHVDAIGIAERHENGIVYADCNDTNIKRDDSLGEFLNRPLFIMSNITKK